MSSKCFDISGENFAISSCEPRRFVNRKPRTIQLICTEAEKSKNERWELQKLLSEILLDQDHFEKSEWEFMYEFICGFIDEIDKANTYTVTYQNPNA